MPQLPHDLTTLVANFRAPATLGFGGVEGDFREGLQFAALPGTLAVVGSIQQRCHHPAKAQRGGGPEVGYACGQIVW